MDDENITLDALPDGDQLTPADASGAVENVASQGDTLTLAELNAALGKNFTSKDSAIKAYKDTFSYVGQREEDIKNKVLSELKQGNETEALKTELQAIRRDMFYKDNPELADYRQAIDKLGEDPAKVVNTPEFKTLIEKASGYDKSQKLKTVLESNPRIASSRDTLTKAREALSAGDPRSRAEAEDLAVQAVMEAYSKE